MPTPRSVLARLALAVVGVALSAGVGRAAVVDLVFVVDESASMAGNQAWLAGMITTLDARLNAVGITGRYGLVGFGANTTNLQGIAVGGGQYGTASQFATATNTLVSRGSTEDGYAGVKYALTNYASEAGVAKNIVLVTDEDRDVTAAGADVTTASLLADLAGSNALLNAVVNNRFTDGGNAALGVDSTGKSYSADGSGGVTTGTSGTAGKGQGTTTADYVALALASGGAAFDIGLIEAGGSPVDSLTAAFVDVKVREIQDQLGTNPVPAPPAVLLAGVGMVLFGMRRTVR